MCDLTLPRQHTTITTMSDTRGNWPLESHRRPYIPIRHVWMIKEVPPIKRICFWWGIIGYMVLKMLVCCGDDAPPQSRRILRSIGPINSPKAYPLDHGVVTSNQTRQRVRLACGWDSTGAQFCLLWSWSGWLLCTPNESLQDSLFQQRLSFFSRTDSHICTGSKLSNSSAIFVRQTLPPNPKRYLLDLSVLLFSYTSISESYLLIPVPMLNHKFLLIQLAASCDGAGNPMFFIIL